MKVNNHVDNFFSSYKNNKNQLKKHSCIINSPYIIK